MIFCHNFKTFKPSKNVNKNLKKWYAMYLVSVSCPWKPEVMALYAVLTTFSQNVQFLVGKPNS